MIAERSAQSPRAHLQYYRDKIRAEIEGKTYVPPAPSASNNSLSRAGSAGSTRSARAAPASANDSWDDWGKPPNVKVSVNTSSAVPQDEISAYLQGCLEAQLLFLPVHDSTAVQQMQQLAQLVLGTAAAAAGVCYPSYTCTALTYLSARLLTCTQ